MKRERYLFSAFMGLIALSLVHGHAQRLRWLPMSQNALSGRAFAVDSISNRASGSLILPNGYSYACYWDNIDRQIDGAFLFVDHPSRGLGVDTTGVIVGSTFTPDRGFQYQSESLSFLPNPYGGFPSYANSISSVDGIIVGSVLDSFNNEFPVYWLSNIPQILPGGIGSAKGISPDGSVIVGHTNSHATIWIDGLPLVISNQQVSQALDASLQGNAVVGRADGSGFVYEKGALTHLQVLSNHSSSNAYSIDAFAQTIVGSSNGSHAVMWIRQPNGSWDVVDLNLLCRTQLAAGDRLTVAQAISLDGRYIVGMGYRATTGRNEPFVIDLNTCPRALGDVNWDGQVDDSDLIMALFSYGASGDADVNSDGIVDDSDLLAILFNFGNQQLCSDCCEATLLVYNRLPNVARIVLVPSSLSAIREIYADDEDDAWKVQRRADGSLVVSYELGTFPVLLGDMQDEILHLRLTQGTTLNTYWYDEDGNLIKQERIEAPCIPNTQLDEENSSQWQINRDYISGVSDDDCFSAFVPNICDPDEYDFDTRVDATGFRWDIECSGSTLQLNLQVDNPDSEANYSWILKIDGQEQYQNGTSLALVIPSDTRNIVITLKVAKRGGNGEIQETSSQKTICLPTAEFEASPATVICDNNGNITGYKIKVTPKGVCDPNVESVSITRYSWSYASTSTNGTGNPVSTELMLPASASGSQEVQLSIEFGAGCTRTKTHRVEVLTPCTPRFRVKYTLCSTGCQDAPDTIPVNFVCTNLNRNDCTNYEWSFGGGNWVSNNNETVSQTVNFNKYELWNQDCTPREQSYAIRLRATHRNCSSGVIYTLNFTVRPVQGRILVTVCPNGETNFCAVDNQHVKWMNGGGLPSGWEAEASRNKCFNYKLKDGSYTVTGVFSDPQDADPSLTGTEVIGECILSHSFRVLKECDDYFRVKGRQNFSHAGKNYRIYYKHKEKKKNIPALFKIVAKTKLKRERRIGSVTYYTWSRADDVEVVIRSNLRSRGSINQTSCDCVQPIPTSVFRDQKNRSSKAKLRQILHTGLGIHKDDTVCSIHRVKIGGIEKIVRLFKPSGALADGVQITNDSSCP